AKVRYAGPAIAVSLGVALLASLTLTPALLRLLGNHVFWPTRPPAPPSRDILPLRPASLGLWDWVSHFVARRPRRVFVCAVALLFPFGAGGRRVQPISRAAGDLRVRAESMRGLAAFQRHFTAGEVGPITVLLTADEDWSSDCGRALIAHLSRGFSRLHNV